MSLRVVAFGETSPQRTAFDRTRLHDAGWLRDFAKDIAPACVSPILYQNLTCEAAGAGEAARVSQAASRREPVRSRTRASKDAVMTTVGVVLFWPSLFFIGGDKGNAAEVARLKGEMQAIEQANISKNCGMQFSNG